MGFLTGCNKRKTDKPYMCSKCYKGFTHIYSMKRHQRTVCGKIRNTNGKYKCECGKSYATLGNLVRHVNNECGVERRFCCYFCHGKFTQNCSRIRHLRKFHKEQFYDLLRTQHFRGITMQKLEDTFGFVDHTGRSTNFVCPKCGKGYTRKTSLQRHLNTGCEDGWINNYHLDYYRLTNDETNEKNHPTSETKLLVQYDQIQDNNGGGGGSGEDKSDNNPINNRNACDFCYRRYSVNGLKKHLQNGCKKNPRNSIARYNCRYCAYTSMYKANMERHVRNIHDPGNRRIRCDLCNFSSNYTFCVRRHMRTFHRK
ncbi:hypothetical protein M0804_014614 [Polistes exclamans]|nr:hypothetical protein M0804_014617 [Polistes exclamans]KAI4474892.1 hypothetical protein M0804_014614 [Polistes exclamans]